jgi:flagellar motor switch protein FliN
MKKDINKPLSWIKKVKNALYEQDEIPLINLSSSFDYDDFSQKLTDSLGVKSINISSSQLMWREHQDIEDGLGSDIIYSSFAFSPVSDKICFLMNKSDVKKLTNSLISESSTKTLVSSEILEEGFFRYLQLNVLSILEKQKAFSNFSAKILDEEISFNKSCLCLDIKITPNKKSSLWGRLVISPEFRTSWQENILSKGHDLFNENLQSLEMQLGIEAGHVQLSFDELKKIKVGDFVILDRAKFDPIKSCNLVSIKLGNETLYQAHIEENKLKIINFGINEVDRPMENKKNEEEIIEDKEAIEGESDEEIFEEKQEIAPPPAKAKKPISLKKMPLTISVEIASFNITLDKLMKLQPGNFLELPVSAEQGVDLLVNNQKIGKAELVNLEDALGIRIIEMG